MKVVLLQDVKGQGKKDQVINVSDGYACNFLFPRKLAVMADTQTLNAINRRKAEEERVRAEEHAAAKALAERLDSLLIKVPKSANQERLYGAVTAQDVCDALSEQHGIELDRRKIVLKDPIKSFGEYKLEVKLQSEVTGTLHVLVCEKS